MNSSTEIGLFGTECKRLYFPLMLMLSLILTNIVIGLTAMLASVKKTAPYMHFRNLNFTHLPFNATTTVLIIFKATFQLNQGK